MHAKIIFLYSSVDDVIQAVTLAVNTDKVFAFWPFQVCFSGILYSPTLVEWDYTDMFHNNHVTDDCNIKIM